MNPSSTPPRSLVLIGFMGSGKSAIGRELQSRIGYPLVDMDQTIEERAGMPITEIFAHHGEVAFRDMESALLRELNAQPEEQRIISTGGGAVVRPENRDLLRTLGYVVWLKAPPEVILERTAKNKSRPLLQTEDPMARILSLLSKREPMYAATAHLQIDTSGLDCGEVATGILECAQYFFTHRA